MYFLGIDRFSCFIALNSKLQITCYLDQVIVLVWLQVKFWQFYFQSVLAVQRQKNNVQFIGVTSRGPNGVLDTANEYSQNCRSKSSTILG